MTDFTKDFEYTITEIQFLIDKRKPLLELCKSKEPDYYYCVKLDFEKFISHNY